MTVNRNAAKASATATVAENNQKPESPETQVGPTATDADSIESGTDRETPALVIETPNPTDVFNLPVHVKPVSIEERLQKFEALEQLKERRVEVLDALQNLKGFYISPAGDSSVQMTDSRRKTLRVSHPVAIEAMINSAIEKMDAELVTIEAKFQL